MFVGPVGLEPTTRGLVVAWIAEDLRKLQQVETGALTSIDGTLDG
jgi:hypothetical protein